MRSAARALPVDWAVASRTRPGQTESGDRHLVAPCASGVLLGALDGLGHGAEAAAAARAALALLELHRGAPLIDLVQRCHAALPATRGVVMSLGAYDARERTLAWIGVGNVEGVLLRAHPGADPPSQTLLLRGGVVGFQLPELLADVVSVARGDTLIFATDGVRPGFEAKIDPLAAPQEIADRILAESATTADDALVLVARFRGVAA
jgi:negative regulator of sigma-B (phosphoserine phosphatase)